MSRMSFQKIFIVFFVVLLLSSWVYGAINYSEFFLNGSTVIQSQSNGWTTPVNSASKEIMTPEWCKRITSVQWQIMFIPTKTIAEWNSFKSGIPVGVIISECYTYSWLSGWWWTCSWETGVWNYGGWWDCSVSCGGGNQTRTAGCIRWNNWTQTRSVSCQRNDGTTVSDSYCSWTKPWTSQNCTQGTDAVCGTAIVSQNCNTQACPPAYVCINPNGNIWDTYGRSRKCHCWFTYDTYTCQSNWWSRTHTRNVGCQPYPQLCK